MGEVFYKVFKSSTSHLYSSVLKGKLFFTYSFTYHSFLSLLLPFIIIVSTALIALSLLSNLVINCYLIFSLLTFLLSLYFIHCY